MVAITLAGQTYDVAPYKIGAMRRAAPIIDRLNARAGSLATIDGMMESASDLIAFVLIGLQRQLPDLTQEAMENDIGLDDMTNLRDAFMAILSASGLKTGEAKAPVAVDAPEALETPSDASSTSSSLPA